ncbi:MAG TPA: hypothetical protein VN256_13065 [Pyrinomonadaceae bacterium]|nr:hypothetical protein [Pyrinomonadaceae bacterium]
MGHLTRDITAHAVHKSLRLHPNFEFPEPPETPFHDELVEFITETVARYLSPPKVEGENEEFACVDVASAIRNHLKPEILRKLHEANEKRWRRK